MITLENITRQIVAWTAFALCITSNAMAADCQSFDSLLEEGKLLEVEQGLRRSLADRACAFHLASAYEQQGNVEQAIEWINYARLFANRDRDPELYFRIVYLKLTLDPDGDLRFQGLESPHPYNAEADRQHLRRASPELFQRLKRTRYRKSSLMKEMKAGFAQNRFPSIEAVEDWVDTATQLESDDELPPSYSTTLALAQGYNQCRKNRACYKHLCKSDPCLAFVSDDRLRSKILGKELFDLALENVERAIESKVTNATKGITRFFLEGDADPEQEIRAFRLQGRLELLAKNYGAYTDHSNITKLQGLAKIDLLILNAPTTFGAPEAVSWIEQLQALQEEDALEASYANSVKILRLYDQCRTSGGPPTANDPCLQLIAHWNASSEIRRRNLVQIYHTGAERLLSEKSSKAVKDLVAKLDDQSPSKKKLKRLKVTVNLLNTYYLPYLEDEAARSFQVAMRQHPNMLDIQSLTGFEEEVAPDTESSVFNLENPLPQIGEPEDARERTQYTVGHETTVTEEALDDLHKRLFKDVRFFQTAHTIWQGKTMIFRQGEVEEFLASAIAHLKTADLKNTQELVQTLRLFSQFQRAIVDDRESAHFVRYYFTAWRWLQLGDTENMRSVLKESARGFQPSSLQIEAIKALEKASVYAGWTSTGQVN